MIEEIEETIEDILTSLDVIEDEDMPAVESGFTKTKTLVGRLEQGWKGLGAYGLLDGGYAVCNASCTACFEVPTELRQDVEVALKPGYLAAVLDFHNQDLIESRTIDFGTGLKVTLSPGGEEPGRTSTLPILSLPQQACHGAAPEGMGAGELGFQPGLAASLSGRDEAFQLRLGVAFALFADSGGAGALDIRPARGHGVCPSGLLSDAIVELSYARVFDGLKAAAPRRISLEPFIPALSDEVPRFELFSTTRNDRLVNLHFLYSDRERRPRRRLERLHNESDWSYAARIEITPLVELINDGLEAFDFESQINDNIPDVEGAEVIDVHITRQEACAWRFRDDNRSFDFDFDLDYDFVLLGFPVKGTLFGEINVRTRHDLPWEAMIAFSSRERREPTVNAGVVVIDTARLIVEIISSELFSRIGPEIGDRTIFAPGNISLVQPQFGPDHLRLDVWV
jgi:hypothetical protein